MSGSVLTTPGFDLAQVSRVLWTLRDYLGDLIIVGGWVPALYQLSETIPGWRSSVSRTTEVDVLLPDPLPPTGRAPIADVLASERFDPVDAGPSFAIWTHQEGSGDTVEFMTPHRGTHEGIGRVREVRDQDRLGAIQLPQLEILYEFATELEVIVDPPGHAPTLVRVRVPSLGAFIVSRGAIFLKRSKAAGQSKPGKDLLYVHDVLAGGRDVMARVITDLGTMVSHSTKAKDYVEYSANNIKLALSSRNSALDEAAAMLVEREGLSHDSALAGIRGYLTDFVEMVYQAVSNA